MKGKFDASDLRSRLQAHDPLAERRVSKPPEAAVSVILDPFLTNESMLLIARTERTGDVWSGQVALPGGRKAAGDQNLYETAIRETIEEVGIALSDHGLLGVLPVVYARAHRIGVLPFVFRLRTKVSILANREVADSFWVPLRFFMDVQPSQTVVDFEGNRALADCYTYDTRVIWGLTFRIINHLIGRPTRPEDWRPI